MKSSTSSIKKSYSIKNRLSSNWSKSKPLEYAINEVHRRKRIAFTDLTSVYNGVVSYDHRVPDQMTEKHVIEDKNWNCENYYVTRSKAYSEIFNRFINFLELKKILIISKPRWCRGAKEWLKAVGVEILELGYFVTWRNVGRAINDIIRFFIRIGYVNTSLKSMKSSSLVVCGERGSVDSICSVDVGSCVEECKSKVNSNYSSKKKENRSWRRLSVMGNESAIGFHNHNPKRVNNSGVSSSPTLIFRRCCPYSHPKHTLILWKSYIKGV